MKKNIVHIGYHKTATNWFQHVLYPQVPDYRYVRRKRVRDAFIETSAFQFSSDVGREKLGTEATNNLILCEEELSGNIHSGGLFGCLSKEIANRVRASLPESRIVVFIRNQTDLIASAYRQYVKEGGTHGVNRYIFHHRYLPRSGFRPAKAAFFSIDHFDFYPLIALYQELFGKDQVFVYLYEDFAENKERFVERFCEELDIRVDPLSLEYKRLNPGYRSRTLYLARFFNHFTHRDVADKRYYLNMPIFRTTRTWLSFINRLAISGKYPTSYELLGRENTRWINERFSRNNRRLEDELRLPLTRFGYPVA